MTSRGPTLAVLVCLFGSAPTARLARAAGKATDANADTPAAQLIADAVTEYDAGRYDEARALFRLAHQKAPTARTLRGIGMASFELRDYVEAARSLAGALRDERRPLTDEQRKQVEGLLARAETFVGRFSLRIQPASHDLLVDGQPTALEPDGSLLLGFGHHRITARCPACAPTDKTVEVEVLGGEHREIEIAFAPATQAAAPDLSPRAGGPTISAGDQPVQPASAGRDVTPWYWTGAAAVGVVGATVGALWWPTVAASSTPVGRPAIAARTNRRYPPSATSRSA
jgi:tetratricopeptide (TPR) repeat protein